MEDMDLDAKILWCNRTRFAVFFQNTSTLTMKPQTVPAREGMKVEDLNDDGYPDVMNGYWLNPKTPHGRNIRLMNSGIPAVCNLPWLRLGTLMRWKE